MAVTMHSYDFPYCFAVLEASYVDGKEMYSVDIVSRDALNWLYETFVNDVDFFYVSSLKGVWFDMTEETFTLFKLKWS